MFLEIKINSYETVNSATFLKLYPLIYTRMLLYHLKVMID